MRAILTLPCAQPRRRRRPGSGETPSWVTDDRGHGRDNHQGTFTNCRSSESMKDGGGYENTVTDREPARAGRDSAGSHTGAAFAATGGVASATGAPTSLNCQATRGRPHLIVFSEDGSQFLAGYRKPGHFANVYDATSTPARSTGRPGTAAVPWASVRSGPMTTTRPWAAESSTCSTPESFSAGRSTARSPA